MLTPPTNTSCALLSLNSFCQSGSALIAPPLTPPPGLSSPECTPTNSDYPMSSVNSSLLTPSRAPSNHPLLTPLAPLSQSDAYQYSGPPNNNLSSTVKSAGCGGVCEDALFQPDPIPPTSANMAASFTTEQIYSFLQQMMPADDTAGLFRTTPEQWSTSALPAPSTLHTLSRSAMAADTAHTLPLTAVEAGEGEEPQPKSYATLRPRVTSTRGDVVSRISGGLGRVESTPTNTSSVLLSLNSVCQSGSAPIAPPPHLSSPDNTPINPDYPMPPVNTNTLLPPTASLVDSASMKNVRVETLHTRPDVNSTDPAIQFVYPPPAVDRQSSAVYAPPISAGDTASMNCTPISGVPTVETPISVLSADAVCDLPSLPVHTDSHNDRTGVYIAYINSVTLAYRFTVCISTEKFSV